MFCVKPKTAYEVRISDWSSDVCSSDLKVTWLLTELGIAFQMEDVGGEFGGNRTPEYLRLNPNGVVPALIDADTSVWESNTILRYIANRFGPTHFYPSDPAARAACECWMD